MTAAGEEQRELYDDSDIDRILAQEATGVQRDEEVGYDFIIEATVTSGIDLSARPRSARES